MSQITEQVASGTLPDATENILYSHCPSKQADPKRTETDSSLTDPKSADAMRTSEEVPRCSLKKGGAGDGTNRGGRDYHSTQSGKAVKRHLAAVDEGIVYYPYNSVSPKVKGVYRGAPPPPPPPPFLS